MSFFTPQTIVMLYIIGLTALLMVTIYGSLSYRDYLAEVDPLFLPAWRRMMWPVIFVYLFLKYTTLFQIVILILVQFAKMLHITDFQRISYAVQYEYPYKMIYDAYQLLSSPPLAISIGVGLLVLWAGYWWAGYKKWIACYRFAHEGAQRFIMAGHAVFTMLYVGGYVLYLFIWHDVVFINGLFVPLWKLMWPESTIGM